MTRAASWVGRLGSERIKLRGGQTLFLPLLRALYAEPSSSSLLSFFFRLIFFSFLSISTPNETARGFMARTSFRNASNGPSLTTSWLLWSSIQLLLVTAVRRCSVLSIERCKDKNLPALLSRSNLKTTFAGMTGQSFFFFLLSMFLSIPFFFPPFYMTCWPGATADRLGLVMTSKQELRGGGWSLAIVVLERALERQDSTRNLTRAFDSTLIAPSLPWTADEARKTRPRRKKNQEEVSLACTSCGGRADCYRQSRGYW